MLQSDSDSDSLVFQALVDSGAHTNLLGFQIDKRVQLSQEELPKTLSASALDERLICNGSLPMSSVT